MKIHGKFDWTSKRRMSIAVMILDAATVKGVLKDEIRQMGKLARDVLCVNGELLDRRIESYRYWVERL